MPNPDWKYGDILRPTVTATTYVEPEDRVMFLTEWTGETGFFLAVNLNLAVDNEIWLGGVRSWELDTDA